MIRVGITKPASTSAFRCWAVVGWASPSFSSMKMAQTPVQHYLPMLMERIEKGEIDPSFVVTHRGALEDGPDLYKLFRDKQDGCVKVVLKP